MTKQQNNYLSGQALEDAIEANKFIYDEHYREDFADSIIQTILDLLDPTYFRSELVGFDELPKRNNPDVPLIYASNHSGMAFPWDAMVFGAKLYRKAGNDFHDAARALSAPMLSQSKLMNPYMVPNLWKKVGAVDATMLNFETMMRQQGANILIYPEGVPGIGKGFHKRYQLQKFSTSFVRMSMKYKTDIIPVHTINAEYIHPYSYSSERINKLVNMIGIPFLPMSYILPLILLQPWMFYQAFPSKLIFVKGKRLSPWKWVDKPFEELTRKDFEEVRDKVHEIMQQEMDEAVKEHGKKPYDLKSLWKKTKENFKQFPFTYPIAWPLVFLEFERAWKQRGASGRMRLDFGKMSFWKLLWRNPMAIFYYIPILGWFPLAYRGLKGRDPNRKVWTGK